MEEKKNNFKLCDLCDSQATFLCLECQPIICVIHAINLFMIKKQKVAIKKKR